MSKPNTANLLLDLMMTWSNKVSIVGRSLDEIYSQEMDAERRPLVAIEDTYMTCLMCDSKTGVTREPVDGDFIKCGECGAKYSGWEKANALP